MMGVALMWFVIGYLFGLAMKEKEEEARRRKADPKYHMVNEE
jgi:hypothetical protein